MSVLKEPVHARDLCLENLEVTRLLVSVFHFKLVQPRFQLHIATALIILGDNLANVKISAFFPLKT